MAQKSLNMMEKMVDPDLIDYYIVNFAMPLKLTIVYRYHIDFDNPELCDVNCLALSHVSLNICSFLMLRCLSVLRVFISLQNRLQGIIYHTKFWVAVDLKLLVHVVLIGI